VMDNVSEYALWFVTQAPWLILGLFALPLALLARYCQVYPRAQLAVFLTIPLVLGLVSIVVPAAMANTTSQTQALMLFATLLVGIIDGLVLLIIFADLWLLPNKSDFSVTREMQKAASIAVPHPIELTVDYRGTRPVWLKIKDDEPTGTKVSPPEHSVRLEAKKRWQAKHTIAAGSRGPYEMENVYLNVRSFLGFWDKNIIIPCRTTLHVYPDMKQLAEYAILARSNRLSLIGVRRSRKIGQDSDFERLRDYTLDDNYKFIDWRSTARRNKLTVKDFQSDQSQRVVFMLDCGRMMTNTHFGLSLVDYALNSLLMLSHVALTQGDSVGLVCFSDKVDRYVPPRSGRSQMNQLLHAGFDRFPRLVESRMDQAFLHLSSNLRKRSLVVLITSVIDQVNADQITAYLGNLQQRHLPLLVLLRDHRIFDAADNPASDPDVLYRSAAAASLLTWREQVLHRLRMQGVLVVDAFPEQMTSPMINEYLKAKAKHLL